MKMCPYLGKVDDPVTPVLFPSKFNGCHRLEKVWKPDMAMQEQTCLRESYHQCPIYLQNLNTEQESISNTQPKKRRRLWIYLMVALVLLLVDLLIVWLLQSASTFGRVSAGAITPSASAETRTATQTPTPARPTASLQPSATLTFTLAPSITPRVAARVDLDTPFGGTTKFVIHRLKAGDSFAEISARYGTTIEVIKWVNYKLHVPLREGEVIVIPVDVAVVDEKMPAFEAYQVQVPSTTVLRLAHQLNANDALLCIYNDLQPDYVLLEQHWLIIPRERE